MEVFLLSKELLLELVDECAAHDQFSFRRDVLQARKDQMNIRTYLWGGYVAQFRSVVGYYERSMQLLCPAVRRELFHPDRPIRAKGEDKSSTYIGADGVCINSLVAEGCNIEGRVENSVLFPGVTVAAGAEVRNCILFKETSVGSGTLLSHIIADKRVRVNPNRTLMGHAAYPVVLAKESVI